MTVVSPPVHYDFTRIESYYQFCGFFLEVPLFIHSTRQISTGLLVSHHSNTQQDKKREALHWVLPRQKIAEHCGLDSLLVILHLARFTFTALSINDQGLSTSLFPHNNPTMFRRFWVYLALCIALCNAQEVHYLSTGEDPEVYVRRKIDSHDVSEILVLVSRCCENFGPQ
jgi:hypothetical protein